MLRCIVGHTPRELIGVLTLMSMVMAPDVAVAQDRALSLDELLHAGSLQPGEGVYVTDAAGRRLKGTLSDVSAAGLVVRHGGQAWTVAVADVRRIDPCRWTDSHHRQLDDTAGFIDLFWPGVLLVEQKSAGRDLAAASQQAGTYFDALPERDRPRFQLLCNFQSFELLDRDEREKTCFALADLPQHVERFGFIIGVQRRTFRDQDPVNIEASELIARLHDALKASGYDGHDLERFLVRTVFCLFADNTGIFEPRDIFLQFIEQRTAADGADLGPWMARMFQVLNTPPNRRFRALDEDLARFPHVNGDLFAEPLRIPDFDAAMRQALLDAGQFDWTAISPTIFGALFQSVMEPADLRAQGAHYPTEKNILKVIEPLFLDDLRGEFQRLQARRDGRTVADLRKFRDKLGSLRRQECNNCSSKNATVPLRPAAKADRLATAMHVPPRLAR